MRIVAGKYRHRLIDYPENNPDIRPTKDMVREGVFSALGDISSFKVLDLFAGSGQIALEAVSRGASFAYLCDNNKECIKIIKENFEKAHLQDTMKVFQEDYSSMLNTIKDVRFEIIYIVIVVRLRFSFAAIVIRIQTI